MRMDGWATLQPRAGEFETVPFFKWIKLNLNFTWFQSGYLASEDCNFIAVDWSILANGEYVPVANNNVPIAGSVTGAFIDFLVDYGAAIDSFHLSGFSMGSHVVGIAGSSVKSGRLPRITGKDLKLT